MTFGLSIDQEICLILGQVSLSSLYWMRNLQTDILWSRERLTKRQATSRPDHVWPELWTKLGRTAKLRERQKWSIEKPKLDNARRLRGIYFIDPEDKEFKEIIRNAGKNLETPMAPAMPCKTCKKSKNGETRSKTDDFKSKFACILEASESTRMQMEESPQNYHEGHVAGKGDNSLQHYNLVSCLKNSKVRMSRYLDTSTTTQMAKIMSSMEDPVVPLAGLLWKGNLRKSN